MDERFGASPTQIGLLISVASVAAGIVSLRLAAITRHIGIRGVLLTAFSLYAASMALIPALDEILWLALPAALFGAGNGLNIPTVQSWLARSVERDVRAGVMSLNATTLRLGQTLGPMIASAGYALGGVEGAFATGILAALLLILLGVGLTRGANG